MEKTKSFLDSIRESLKKDEPFLIVFYGASTTSQENVFPSWPEIIRYFLKNESEETDYKKSFWNIPQ